MTTTQELTGTRLKERVARFMGWARASDWPPELDLVTIANEAGEWLVGLRPWNWLVREPAELSLTQGQSWITLPTDFGRHVKLIGNATGSATVRQGSMQEVALARAGIVGSTNAYVYAYGFSGPSTAGPKPDVRLFVGPVPTANATNVLTLTYLAGWKPLTDAVHHVLVPSWCMSLYVRAVCLHVAGWEHDLAGSLEDRLDRLLASSLYTTAADIDDTIESDLGPMRGGVEETLMGASGEVYGGPISQSIVQGS